MSFGVIAIILFFCKGTKNYPKSKKNPEIFVILNYV